MVWPKSNTQIIDRDRMYVCVCVYGFQSCSVPEQSSHSLISLFDMFVWNSYGQNDLPNHRECSAWIFMAWHADQEFISGIYICSSYALKYFTIYYIFFIIWNCTSNDYSSWYLSIMWLCDAVPDGVAQTLTAAGTMKREG